MSKPRIIFTVTLGELSEVPGSPYAYWAPKSLRDLFKKYPPLDRDVAGQPDKPKIADVKQGLATADDLRFTRYWWEVPVEQIATSREETFEGKKWVPFAKGGKPFFHDVSLVVNWEKDGEEIKNYRDLNGKPLSRPQNESFYFREGLTFPNIVSSNRVNARVIPEGCIFTVKHQGIFTASHNEDLAICAFLNSTIAGFFHYCMNPLRHGRDTGEISKLPVNPMIQSSVNLANFAHEIWSLLRDWATGNELLTIFVLPWLLQILWRQQGKTDSELLPITKHPLSKDFQWSSLESAKKIKEMIIGAKKESNVSLVDLAKKCVQWEIMLRQRTEEIQRQIDDEVYKLYGISEEDRGLIEAELGKPLEEEIHEEEDTVDDEEAEEDALPEGVISAEEHIRRLVHYIAHEVIKSDADGIVPLFDTYTVDGRLERGLVYRVTEKFKEIFGESAMETIEKELREVLGGPLDFWLASEFFNYHVSLFRLRPIIWQITSRPKGESKFNCFIYWHKLDKDTLRKVQEVYLRPALDSARIETERQAEQLAEKQAAGAPLKLLQEAEKIWRQARERYEELRTLDEKIKNLLQPHRLKVQSRSTWVQNKVNEIVAYGYQPNRDYGVRVNIEPLKQAGILPFSANRVKG